MKYVMLLTLAMCGCANATPSPATPTPPVEEAPALGTPVTPVTLELANKESAEAIRCTDGLDCIQKLAGLCKNGYSGSRMLNAENGRVVGVMYKCVTDGEKAEADIEAAQEKAQEAAYEAERQARLKQMEESARTGQQVHGPANDVAQPKKK